MGSGPKVLGLGLRGFRLKDLGPGRGLRLVLGVPAQGLWFWVQGLGGGGGGRTAFAT